MHKAQVPQGFLLRLEQHYTLASKSSIHYNLKEVGSTLSSIERAVQLHISTRDTRSRSKAVSRKAAFEPSTSSSLVRKDVAVTRSNLASYYSLNGASLL